MAATVLFEIKKKQRVTTTKKSPFPLIFHLGSEEKQSIVTWQFYRGTLKPDGVEISTPEEMKNLYYMGYFGKGTLSRSAPEKGAANSSLPPKMSSRRYERHCRLASEKEVEIKEAPRTVLVKQDGCAEPSHKGADDSGIHEDSYYLTEDPYPIDEHLQLFFEEAFFLSFGLGCLIVGENGKDLELLELWQRLCTLCPDFPARYTVYHHFRTKGWVVRTGSKYGTDFLLYKDGPPFYHATFSVLVRSARGVELHEVEDCRFRSWMSLGGLTRLNFNATKTVLLCYVIIPLDVDLSTPECVRNLLVQETLVRRWVLAEEGEKVRQAQMGQKAQKASTATGS